MGENKIIGEKIKNFREMKNISVEEMVERSGLPEEQIIRIEGNEDFPSLAPLIKIARVLGVRLGTFLDDQTEIGPVLSRKSDREGNDGIGFTNNATTKHKY
ncbi:MAG: helix-turn-helix domain-containing protein, partial [Tannerella sp.]|nr:helix-turn-helix domain-containing protein [Tannerella sp.]